MKFVCSLLVFNVLVAASLHLDVRKILSLAHSFAPEHHLTRPFAQVVWQKLTDHCNDLPGLVVSLRQMIIQSSESSSADSLIQDH